MGEVGAAKQRLYIARIPPAQAPQLGSLMAAIGRGVYSTHALLFYSSVDRLHSGAVGMVSVRVFCPHPR